MTYPIISQKVLSPVPQSGRLFGLRSRRRDTSEIPPPTAGQVLVFRSGGRYVLDSGRLGLDDEIVLEATHVSIVDVTENKQVRTEFTVPSAEGGEFTVRVDFTCRVHDPVAVVEAGLGDVRDALAGYLRAHEDVFKAGAKYKLADFLEARTEVRAELQAYHHYLPVRLSGMTATLSNVEIPAPSEVKEYVGKAVRDDLDHQDRLAGLSRGGKYDRAQALEETETRLHRLKLEVLSTEQEINKLNSDRQKEAQREADEEAALAAAHRRRDLETTFDIDRAAKVTAAVGDDPLMAYALAAERDEIGAKELADFHQQEADRLHLLERLREDRAHEDAVQNAQLSRETQVQGVMLRLEVLKEMVRKGHLDERGVKEIDGILHELTAGKTTAPPAKTEPGRGIEPAAGQAREELAAPPRIPGPDTDTGEDVPYREEDL
ncbi:SPFH domain-containing protein [Actinomadura sp. WMMB 499]|uniref:SPFH domain-containing protein n=1 Tax=Actinomadura sp. WMMB 499 TaxID=1219491 RepID=UPI00159D3E9B|nr:SPFH domain-containing protein [Actinomadura sp. WMMB 499]